MSDPSAHLAVPARPRGTMTTLSRPTSAPAGGVPNPDAAAALSETTISQLCSSAGRAGDRTDATPNPFAALVETLAQLAGVLNAASDGQYIQKPVGVIASSLGGHVRHCLDHFAALCRGAETGQIDYEDRERGTAIECSRAAALAAIAGLRERVARLDARLLMQSVSVRSLLTADGAAIECPSSLGRELAFVLSHTIHHNALVAAMCHTLGIPIPERFGYAPATLAHLDATACAPSPSCR